MNDRYLYRAKRTDKMELVEGNLIWSDDADDDYKAIIIPTTGSNMFTKGGSNGDLGFEKWYRVDPSTLCQCTGMPDKNSNVAYEHDIIETPVGNAKIIWNCSPSPTDNHINVGFEVVFFDATANDNYRHDLGYWIGKSEVISNIFDNTELLESKGCD